MQGCRSAAVRVAAGAQPCKRHAAGAVGAAGVRQEPVEQKSERAKDQLISGISHVRRAVALSVTNF